MLTKMYSISLLFHDSNIFLKQGTTQTQIQIVITKLKKNSQVSFGKVSCFTHLSRDNFLQPYFNQHFKWKGKYKFHVFDIHYEKNFSSPQHMKLKFIFRQSFPPDVPLTDYVLVKTNMKISTSSDGQRNFDLIWFKCFHTMLIFLKSFSVFLSLVLLYPPDKFVVWQYDFVFLITLVIGYNLYDQFVVIPYEKIFLLSISI